MSKAYDQRDEHGTLADSELGGVSGGAVFEVEDFSFDVEQGVGGGGNSTGPAIGAWNACLKVLGYR